MQEIKIKTNKSDQAVTILQEAIKTEELRLEHALNIAQKRLENFEKKYGVPSEVFINEWSSEDLEKRDIEYVEWAGEFKMFLRLKKKLSIFQGIEYVT